MCLDVWCRYEAALDPWLAMFWTAMRERFPLPRGLVDPDPKNFGSTMLDRPKLKVTYFEPSTDALMADLTIDDHPGMYFDTPFSFLLPSSLGF
jgi:hypothetical protein